MSAKIKVQTAGELMLNVSLGLVHASVLKGMCGRDGDRSPLLKAVQSMVIIEIILQVVSGLLQLYVAHLREYYSSDDGDDSCIDCCRCIDKKKNRISAWEFLLAALCFIIVVLDAIILALGTNGSHGKVGNNDTSTNG